MGLQSTQGYRGKLVDKLTGIILDQFADEDIKVSNNILELFDLGEIPGTYTQQITLPGTKKNNAFFEQYYDISVWEPDIFNTNQVVEAYLDFDAFYLVNGYLQLNKVNVIENKFVDSYEVTLFGIISNFSIDTRSSFLTDISSLSVYNHTSSYANITSSWGRGLFNGDIVYPMIEYGNDATDQPNFYFSQVDFLGIDDFESGVIVSDFKPAIRIKKVWDAIFNEFGYTYTGSFWNEPFLNDVYLPLNNNKQVAVYNPSIETYYQAKLTNVSASATTLTAYVSQSFPVNSKEYDYNNAAVLTGGSFTYTTDITTRLDVKLNLAFQVISGSFGAGSGMPAFYINYMSGSTSVNQQTLARMNGYLGTIAQSRTSVVTEIFNLKNYIFQAPELDPGTYTFQIYYIPQYYNNFQVKLNPDINNQSSWEIYRVRQAADFKVLDVPANMPFGTSGIKVIDFIRAIQKKFNLVIYPDKLNPNQFVVETFNNWYRQGEIKDFNKYINVKDKIEFTPANQLGYKQVRFSDADDTDYVETLFKRTNNRVYGESNFYDSGSYYSQGKLDVVGDAIASGPLTLIPGSVYSGSAAATLGTCTTYNLTNLDSRDGEAVSYIFASCDGTIVSRLLAPGRNIDFCAQTDAYEITTGNYNIIVEGDCSPAPTGSAALGSSYPMWIPYYIADDKYTPARVLPRLLFYNGLVNSQEWYFEGYLSSTSLVERLPQTKYPYFDNYSTGSLNGTSSQYPQLDSLSLLYNNEQAVWGTTPSGSIVSEYWDKYLALLYNPRTRLVDCTGVIPLADYFNLELNDIAEFRGNYYHLRAINDYNLTTGECNIQMLGPIIGDTISYLITPPSTGSCAFSASVVSNGSGGSYAINQAGEVYELLVAGTDVYAAGQFTCYNGNTAYDLVKFNVNGEYNATFNTTVGTLGSTGPAGGYAPAGLVIQPTTGKLIFAGYFNRWNNQVCTTGGSDGSVIRLNSDGTLDPTFSTQSAYPPAVPYSVAAFDDGTLLIGSYNFTPSASLYKKGVNGNTLFQYDINNTYNITSIATFSDYTAITIQEANAGIRRWNADGTAYFPWTSSIPINNEAKGLAISADESYAIVVGSIDTYNLTPVNGIIKISTYDGNLDPAFSLSPVGSFNIGTAVALQTDGKILLAKWDGDNSASGKTAMYRLNSDGTIDSTWTATFTTGSLGPFLGITDIKQLPNGNVLATGGPFYKDFRLFDRFGNILNTVSSSLCT